VYFSAFFISHFRQGAVKLQKAKKKVFIIYY